MARTQASLTMIGNVNLKKTMTIEAALTHNFLCTLQLQGNDDIWSQRKAE